MDIETYAERHPQLAVDEVEPHLLEWLERVRFTTFLDVGCGSGRLIIALSQMGLLEGKEVLGVDLSQTNVELLCARMPSLAATVDDAETLSTVEDECIDFVVSTQVVEHVDDRRMLQALRRIVRSDGVIYISTVFKRTWARFIWRTEQGVWALDPTHLREYTDDAQLTNLAAAAGLRVVDSRKVPFSFPILDFVVRRMRLDPDRVMASRIGRMARKLRVRIPGYFKWSIVLAPAVSYDNDSASGA